MIKHFNRFISCLGAMLLMGLAAFFVSNNVQYAILVTMVPVGIYAYIIYVSEK